ncbi:MAG: response regulator, partial [Vicinamibacteria bacterium]|nr:response regulator [Vicinamibacteria bacterium]
MSDQPEDKAAAPTATPPHKKSPRHELRTPLNQIIGYAEMLEEEALDAKQEGFIPDLRKIAGAAHTLVGLVDKYGALLEERAPAAHASAPLVTPAASVAAPTPRAVEPQPESTPIKKRKRASESAPSSSVEGGPAQERLLVVDDNELNRDMLSRRLAKQGYPVDVAEDGYVALDKIDQGDYALVLLDIMMPGLSGLDVLKTVRATHTMAELPIIMATAKDQSEDTVEALGLGANDYVTKPLDFPVVMARVSTQLALKRASEEIRRLAESLERRNQFIRKTFGRYLSDDIVAELLETPHGLALGGESRIVTVLMSDLRGFTATADRLSPEQVVRILNRYLGVMADV